MFQNFDFWSEILSGMDVTQFQSIVDSYDAGDIDSVHIYLEGLTMDQVIQYVRRYRRY